MRSHLLLLLPLLFTVACDEIKDALNESDTDGDGDPDVTDCNPTDPAISNLTYENTAALCSDGIDNDCDTFIDETDPDCPTTDTGATGGDTGGDTGMVDTWPPDAPTNGFIDYVTGDHTTITNFDMWSAVFDGGDIVLSDPFHSMDHGQVCAWPHATLTLGGMQTTANATWCIDGDPSTYLGIYIHANTNWVVLDAQYTPNASGDPQVGMVHVFSRATLSAGGTFNVNDAVFSFDGTATGSYTKALALDGDTVYVGDAMAGTGGTGQVFQIDLSDPTLVSGPASSAGTTVADQGFDSSELPNFYAVICEDPTTGNKVFATGTPNTDTFSWWKMDTPWTHMGDLQVTSGSGLGLGVDIDCQDDMDADGYLDLLVSGDDQDLTIDIASGLTVPSDIIPWTHNRWHYDPYESIENAGERFAIVNSHAGERWYVVGAANARSPDSARTGAVYFVPESNLQLLPSDHTHAGGLAAVASHKVHGIHSGGKFGLRVATGGTTVIVSDGGGNATHIADMADWLNSVPLGPPPPAAELTEENSLAEKLRQEIWLNRQESMMNMYWMTNAPTATSSTGEVTLEFRPSTR